MLDAKFKEFIQGRIDMALKKRSTRREEQDFIDGALRACVCPSCGGQLLRGSEFLEFFTNVVRYTCLECGAKHRRSYGE